MTFELKWKTPDVGEELRLETAAGSQPDPGGPDWGLASLLAHQVQGVLATIGPAPVTIAGNAEDGAAKYATVTIGTAPA